MRIITLIVILLAILFLGCKKETSNPIYVFGDSLSEEDNDFLETLSVPNPSLHEIYGHNDSLLGRPINTSNDVGNLIDNMLRDAQSLSGQKILLYPQEGNDTTKPAHMGIVYSKGQRNISQRLNPPYGNSLHKTYSVYGTDCSGFIINLFSHSGVNIDGVTTNVMKFEENLTIALKNSDLYKSISVIHMGYQPLDLIKSGDIILWKRGEENNHMGIVAKVANGKTVFQSNGTGDPSTFGEHIKNLGSTRGVHPIGLSTAISTNSNPKKSYWGTGYEILRLEKNIKELIKGQWSVIQTVERHYINGYVVNTTPTNFNNATISFSETGTYSVFDPSENPTTCNGSYILDAEDDEKITMTGCDLNGVNKIQSISTTDMEILGEIDGVINDYFQTTLIFQR